MSSNRLEAFSDGVLAIIITIMVLEFKAPHEPSLAVLRELAPLFLSYLLSFVYLGIYWNNHHHLMHATHRVDGTILWANLHLLFWLSLIPFATHWIGNTDFARAPMAAYGAVLLLSGIAYWLLQTCILRREGKDSLLVRAIGQDLKGKASVLLYTLAIPLAFVSEWLAGGIYVGVALMWLLPDRRIERMIHAGDIKRER